MPREVEDNIERIPPGPLVDGEKRRYYENGQIITVEKFGGTEYYSSTGIDNESTADSTSSNDDGVIVDGGNVVIYENDDGLVVYDDDNVSRVRMGRITSNSFGLKVSNSASSEIFGLYGAVANLAGWTLDTNYIKGTVSGDSVSLTTESSQPRLEVIDSSVTRVKVGFLDGSNVGLRITDSTGSNNIVNITGAIATIGGWSFTDTLFKSTASGARLELDSSQMRVSVLSGDSVTKVAMGYLGGLVKNKSIGVLITSLSTTGANNVTIHCADINSEDHPDAFPDTNFDDDISEGGLAGLEYHMANVSGVADATGYDITSNTFNSITINVTGIYAIINGGFGSGTYTYFVIKFSTDDYGFWALDGDKMRIDGDMMYDSGDWLINSDGALKFTNGAGVEVMRLGTHSGNRGLFLGSGITDSTITARFTQSTFKLGDVDGSSNYVEWDGAALNIVGDVNIEYPEWDVIWQDTFTGDTASTTWVGTYISNNYDVNPGGGANSNAFNKLVVSSEANMGNMILQSGDDNGSDGATAKDESWLVSKDKIPFDSQTTYRISVRIRDTSATSGSVFLGFTCFDINGSVISDTGATSYGNAHWIAADQVNIGSDWVVRTGYMRGVGAPNGNDSGGSTSLTDLGVVYSSTKYISPTIVTNYEGGATGEVGSHEIDYVVVDQLAGGIGSSRTVISGAKITTGKIQSSDTRTYFDLDNDKIIIADDSHDRVALGDVSSDGDASLYGVKVAAPGYTAISANDDELFFSSSWAIPKYAVLFGGFEQNTAGTGLLDAYYSAFPSGTCNTDNPGGTSMQDTGLEEDWEINEWVGSTVVRTNAGLSDATSMRAYAQITANDEDTLTHDALVGGYSGTGNDWDDGDTYTISPKPWGKFGKSDSYYVGTKKQELSLSTTTWTEDTEGTTIAVFPYLHDRNNKYLRLSAFLSAETSLRLGVYRYTWNSNTSAQKLQLELAGVEDKGRFFYSEPFVTALETGDAVWTDNISGSTFGQPAWYVCINGDVALSDISSGATPFLKIGLSGAANQSTYFDEIYDRFPFTRIINTHASNGFYKVETLDLTSHLSAANALKHGDLYIIRLTGGRTSSSEVSPADDSHCVIQPQVSVHGYDFNAINNTNSS